MGRSRKSAGTVSAEVDSGFAELVPDLDLPDAWLLRLNGTPQSHVDLGDPTHLEFEYMRRFGHVVDVFAAPGKPIQALHLGGGALTLARYIAVSRPRSTQQVVEIDAALIDFVRTHAPLDRTWRIKIRHGDARQVLAQTPQATFDLVVADIFAGARTPAHVTSVEFVTLASRALRPNGVYLVNIADGGQLSYARGQAASVAAVFPQVAVVGEPAVLRGRRFGNLVLLGSHHELPLAELTRRNAADPFAGRVLDSAEAERFISGLKPVTDATAQRSPQPPAGTWGLADD